jgi:hypothetical protein
VNSSRTVELIEEKQMMILTLSHRNQRNVSTCLVPELGHIGQNYTSHSSLISKQRQTEELYNFSYSGTVTSSSL